MKCLDISWRRVCFCLHGRRFIWDGALLLWSLTRPKASCLPSRMHASTRQRILTCGQNRMLVYASKLVILFAWPLSWCTFETSCSYRLKLLNLLQALEHTYAHRDPTCKDRSCRSHVRQDARYYSRRTLLLKTHVTTQDARYHCYYADLSYTRASRRMLLLKTHVTTATTLIYLMHVRQDRA